MSLPRRGLLARFVRRADSASAVIHALEQIELGWTPIGVYFQLTAEPRQMIQPPEPPNEGQRLATLSSLNILDTPPEERFDRITRIAQRLFDVPIALVSLVDATRQWFKSNQGLSVAQTPREISFCGHAILGNGTFVVHDAQIDARFCDNPLVTDDPHIRFYAGRPLLGPGGSKLGTLCIIDRRPRTLNSSDLQLLDDLGKLVENELGSRSAGAEIRNLLDIAAAIVPQPGEIPQISGIDIYGESIQLNGTMGGDHIVFIDFNKRYDIEARIKRARDAGKETVAKQLQLTSKRAGILVADVSGHSLTDTALAGRLHDAFLACALYELDICGTITPRLFETLNIRFYNSTAVNKFITMIYGEVSEEGTFRFLSAAHPAPIVFSNEYDRIVDISPERFSIFPPLGTQPPEYHVDRKTTRGNPLGYKKKYEVNEVNLLGKGDIMLIHTDGLSEHENETGAFYPAKFEETLRAAKHLPAADIFREIKMAISAFGKPRDDITCVVIKLG